MPAEDLNSRVLALQVNAVERYARQKAIGESDVHIGDVDLNVPIKFEGSWRETCLIWRRIFLLKLLTDSGEINGCCGTSEKS